MSEKYTIAIEVTGKDAGASNVLDGVGGSLKRVGEFVVGGLIVGGLQKIGSAFLDLGRNAIQSVGNVQMLEKQIGSLLAQNLMYERQADGTFEKVMDFGQATQIAAAQTEDMLGFVQKLAIVSPFKTSDVEGVTKIAIATGMATEEVKDFTAAFMDVAAMKGITDLQFAASQFLQLKQAGALTTIDLRQLSRMGIDVTRIIGTNLSGSLEEAEKRFGTLSPAARKVFSGMELDIKEFNQLAAESPEVIDAIFQKFMLLGEEGAEGAAADMASSISGMMSTASDIVEIGSRNLFRPIFEAISPPIQEVLGKISDFVTSDKIAGIGEAIGAQITKAIGAVETFFQLLAVFDDPLKAFKYALFDLFPPDVATAIGGFVQGLVDGFNGLMELLSPLGDAFMQVVDAYKLLGEGDLEGFFAGIEGAWETALPAIGNIFSKIWEFVQPYLAQFWADFSAWFMSQNWGEIIGTIWNGFVGIGATIWGIVSPELATFFTNVWTWFTSQDWGGIIANVVTFFVDFGTQLWNTVSPTLAEFFTGIYTWFSEQDWVAIGTELVTKIIEGLATFAVNSATTFAEWWASVNTWVQTVDWYSIGFTVVTKVIDGLSAFVTNVGAKLREWFSTTKANVSGMDWASIGTDIVNGIINGITSMAGAIWTALSGIVQGAIDGVRKGTLDANSPSRVTASLLGEPMAQGVGMGWLNEMTRLNALMSTALTGTIQNQSSITNNQNRFDLAVNVNSVNEAQQVMDNYAFRRAWAG